MTIPRDIQPKNFIEGFEDAADKFKIHPPHGIPANEYSPGSPESKSFYLGFLLGLETLDKLINHDRPDVHTTENSLATYGLDS